MESSSKFHAQFWQNEINIVIIINSWNIIRFSCFFFSYLSFGFCVYVFWFSFHSHDKILLRDGGSSEPNSVHTTHARTQSNIYRLREKKIVTHVRFVENIVITRMKFDTSAHLLNVYTLYEMAHSSPYESLCRDNNVSMMSFYSFFLSFAVSKFQILCAASRKLSQQLYRTLSIA